MSVRMLSRVWELSTHGGTELLMLLAIADFADDDGYAYPSVPKLAVKCRMKPRNANYILASLQASGELEVRMNKGPHGQNLYRITLSQTLQSVAPLQAVAPLQGSAQTPAAHCMPPLQPIADKPSRNRQEPSGGAPTRKSSAAAKRPLPADFGVSDQVKAWAASKGYGHLEDHLEAFKLKAEAKGYAYSDWDAAFKSAIRDDWAGLRKSQGARPLRAGAEGGDAWDGAR